MLLIRVTLRKVGLIMAVLLLILISAQTAMGYDTDWRKWPLLYVSWPQYRVNVNYSSLPSTWRTEASDARMEWNNTGASKLYFYYGSSSDNEIIRGDCGDDGVLGLTTAWPLDDYATLTDADTILNINDSVSWHLDGNTFWWWQYDLQSVITHELGHWLVLNHSGVSSATMYSTLNPGDSSKKSLATDDINGIRALYGSK